jgi:penicillin-binding protein 2B
MMQLTIKMLGIEYVPNMTLPEMNKAKVYKELRDAFAQYGMGVLTGSGLQNEATGIVEKDIDSAEAMGHLLDLSFGQYDTYTTLQLAQYAATVANGGNRIAPHVVEGIYGNDADGGLGSLISTIPTKVLNTVPISASQMAIIRQGFYDVVHGSGYATGTLLAGAKLTTSAKTGTAETNVGDTATVNANIVAYAPSESPKLAIGVMFPHLLDEVDQPNKNIAKEIIDAYADMYPQ